MVISLSRLLFDLRRGSKRPLNYEIGGRLLLKAHKAELPSLVATLKPALKQVIGVMRAARSMDKSEGVYIIN
jgi:hypothetical protein